jgi:hypothetical protein
VSNFNKLANIIGAQLADKVSQQMGGTFLRIRKYVYLVKEIYEIDPAYYNQMSVKDMMKSLKCSKREAIGLRNSYQTGAE